jgi:transcriptional regulator with XRE-family HTH domain
MSIGELARRINYSKGYLSRIENDLQRPTPMLAKLCDQVLDTGGELLALVQGGEQAAVSDEDSASTGANGSGEDLIVLAFDDQELRVHWLPRPTLLAGRGFFGDPLTRGSRPMTDGSTVSVLWATYEQLRVLGTMTSPVVVLGQAITQLNSVRMLARDSDAQVRTDLCLLSSRLAEYAGWMTQEAGDDAGALRWTERAVGFAEEGRDPRLASFALYRRAELAMYRLDAIGTIQLARRAQRDTAAGPRVLGLAAQCEAQGHALAGDHEAYETALERAAELLAMPDPDSTSTLGSTSVADQVQLVAGWSLCELGRPGEAAAILDEHVAAIPPGARRARARFGARRALAHAQHGDVDTACKVLREVVEDAAHVDSATVRVDLRQLSRVLRRWHGRPAVRLLQPELMALLHPAERD